MARCCWQPRCSTGNTYKRNGTNQAMCQRHLPSFQMPRDRVTSTHKFHTQTTLGKVDRGDSLGFLQEGEGSLWVGAKGIGGEVERRKRISELAVILHGERQLRTSLWEQDRKQLKVNDATGNNSLLGVILQFDRTKTCRPCCRDSNAVQKCSMSRHKE